ncbi:glucosaminidase domain-containing protein [Neptunicella sp. SCSIO 80796]|uniref:glucosaminidase domain-containing protein n=1 Tax=Neptunicella plasticusilytica TaxID=3117012 RepID=UPI003A4D4E28
MSQYSMHKKSWSQILFRSLITLIFIVALIYPFWYPAPKIKPQQEPETALLLVPDFAKIRSVKKKKQAFFSYLRPELEKQNRVIKQERRFLLELRQKVQQGKPPSANEQQRLTTLAVQYQMNGAPENEVQWNTLLRRVDTIPVELTLVQAANESAWGTSRFAKHGYNFFGLWCYRKGCGFVPKQRDEEAAHEVAKFRDLSHAVRTYLLNLNSYYAYSDLRMIRADLRQKEQSLTPEAIAQGLINYSTRREEYVDELVAMIRHNRKYMQ